VTNTYGDTPDPERLDDGYRAICCSVCHVRHFDAEPPVLAYLGPWPRWAPERSDCRVLLLWPARRETVKPFRFRMYAPNLDRPLAERADVGVTLRCPRCGQRTDGVTARSVKRRFNRQRSPMYLPSRRPQRDARHAS
jgi:hypothetical protein